VARGLGGTEQHQHRAEPADGDDGVGGHGEGEKRRGPEPLVLCPQREQEREGHSALDEDTPAGEQQRDRDVARTLHERGARADLRLRNEVAQQAQVGLEVGAGGPADPAGDGGEPVVEEQLVSEEVGVDELSPEQLPRRCEREDEPDDQAGRRGDRWQHLPCAEGERHGEAPVRRDDDVVVDRVPGGELARSDQDEGQPPEPG
jgi:hypothetical protein